MFRLADNKPVLSLLGALLLAFFSACAVNKENPDANLEAVCGNDPDIEQRKVNFDSTLHALLLQNTCVTCHNGTSGLAPYPHSSTNLNVAYAAALQVSDLQSPTNSKIVKKIASNHNCGSDAECKSLSRAIEAQLKVWKTREDLLAPIPECAGDLKTALKISWVGTPVKISELSSTTATVRRTDVGAINGVVGKAAFSIDIKKFTDKSYTVSNPIFATESMKLKVIGVTPIIGGKLAPQYSNWSGKLNFVVDALAFDITSSFLSPYRLSDFPQQLVEEDTLGWELVLKSTTEAASTTTTVETCKAYDKFLVAFNNSFNKQIQMGGNFVGQCTRCHGDRSLAANAVMDLSGNGQKNPCFQALMRADLKSPLDSLLFLKPSRLDGSATNNVGNEHPVLINLREDAAYQGDRQVILEWLQAEKSARGL